VVVRDGTVLFTGGLFIGWQNTMPSLHATWDALTTINTLFAFYPEPEGSQSTSIFYSWKQ
jgi:hypothetical protein